MDGAGTSQSQSAAFQLAKLSPLTQTFISTSIASSSFYLKFHRFSSNYPDPKMGQRKTVTLTSLTLACIFILAVCSAKSTAMHLSCISNCSQCVKIYAEFFDGRQCAEYCIGMRSWMDGHIDCNDPTSISRFIRYQ